MQELFVCKECGKRFKHPYSDLVKMTYRANPITNFAMPYTTVIEYYHKSCYDKLNKVAEKELFGHD